MDRMKIQVDSPYKGFARDFPISRVVLDKEPASSGKVRESFSLPDGLRLLVSSDRISVFDVVLDKPIPGKGFVLNGISGYNLLRTEKIVPNHLVARSVDSGISWLDDRAMVVKEAEPIKIEAVVRGYLTGSALVDYNETGVVFGVKLPGGMKDGSELPEPMFTPTTKAEVGHDEPMTYEEVEKIAGKETAAQIKSISLELYSSMREDLYRKGLILADTKLEFGFLNVDGGKVLILIDEVGTPDSSRYWSLGPYQQGVLVNEDKEPVRQHYKKLGWNKKAPAPALPEDVVEETSRRYLRVAEKIDSGGVLAQS